MQKSDRKTRPNRFDFNNKQAVLAFTVKTLEFLLSVYATTESNILKYGCKRIAKLSNNVYEHRLEDNILTLWMI